MDLHILEINRPRKTIFFVLILGKDKSRASTIAKGKDKGKGSVLATNRQGLNALLGNVAFIGRYDEPAPQVHVPIPTPKCNSC